MYRNISLKRSLSLAVFVGLMMLIFTSLPAAAQGGPSVRLEQCANDDDGSNPTCANGPAIGWKNSQINGNNGLYALGDFYPNRQIFSNLTVGNIYCFAVGFDYSKGALPAVDYLGSYDETLPADPTLDTSFTLGVDTPDTVAIPAEPALSNGGTISGGSFIAIQIPGELTLWGGSFDAGSLTYSNPGTGDLGANFQQSLEYCFTASDTEAVMAFGAHIAFPFEWGLTDRPTGAAYHVSNGSRNGQFTAPRTSVTDLAETTGLGVVVSHNNTGRTEQQIQSSAIIGPSPTAISFGTFGQASQSSAGLLVGLAFASLATVSLVYSGQSKLSGRKNS